MRAWSDSAPVSSPYLQSLIGADRVQVRALGYGLKQVKGLPGAHRVHAMVVLSVSGSALTHCVR